MARILYGFFAEDIRVETSGQVSAVGLMGPRWMVPVFPYEFRRLSFHACIENFSGELYRLTARLHAPGRPTRGPPQSRIEAQVHNLTLLLAPYEVVEAGRVAVELEIDGMKPVTFSMQIVQGSNPNHFG